MDIIKAEIERKKRFLEEKNLVTSGKKYFKRGDLIKQVEEDYWKKHYPQQEDNEISENEKKQAAESSKSKESENALPRKEVVRRLRERQEPIILYGETEFEAFQRLRRLEILEPEVDRGFRNDFQEAMEKVDQAYLDELMKTQGSVEDGKSVNDVKVEEESTSMEEIKTEAKEKLGKGNDSDDAKVILKFLRFLMQVWGQKLNSRSESEKTGMKGKMASATYTQTQDYIRPLFRRLKKETCPEDILEHLILIVKYMLDLNYVEANAAYLQMAIGNAPWPIGVTMVGIHARTGREKIFSRNIAHVLNDETQRKFIQGLKRLMTQCQRFFPTDPSRSVEYNA
ncbi:pre-mRNA-splicing factor 18 [Parasteatoda tepidariorum]|uniref:pre-mRNA-splicing factor 18 n=1 Tax=Parasteatoda tepidariorum TaxID=114398 RepID=UPI00077F8F58|nr:pre-mRNA-splicing factor 18 [Parasteatoda tepidariorum]XP_015917491.1 pre-mRNA-splicing factor 18 [Parasteatoda tepidariorum]